MGKEDLNYGIDPIVQFLSEFISVSDEEKDYLEKIVIYKSFPKNHIFHREGDVAKYLGIILKGAIRYFYVDEEGSEHTVEFKFENDTMGDFKAIYEPVPAQYSATTIEECHFCGISHESFVAFVNKFPAYFPIVGNILSFSMDEYNIRTKLLRIQSARERYEALCELQPKLINRVPLTYIASYLGMALGTLSRVRAGKL